MNISDKKQIVYQKNYRYLVTIHFDSIWSTSNRLRPNEYCCYLMITYRNANNLATIKRGVQTGATCPKVSSKIRKNKIERFSVFSSQKCWGKPKSMAVVGFPVQNYSVPWYMISVVQSTRSWKCHCWIVSAGKLGNHKSGKLYLGGINLFQFKPKKMKPENTYASLDSEEDLYSSVQVNEIHSKQQTWRMGVKLCLTQWSVIGLGGKTIKNNFFVSHCISFLYIAFLMCVLIIVSNRHDKN